MEKTKDCTSYREGSVLQKLTNLIVYLSIHHNDYLTLTFTSICATAFGRLWNGFPFKRIYFQVHFRLSQWKLECHVNSIASSSI